MSSTNDNGAELQREYWMREFDDMQHDGLIGFDEFQMHLARSALVALSTQPFDIYKPSTCCLLVNNTDA